MKGGSSGSSKLLRILECMICGNIFNDPRITPCNHTFCLSCISQVKQENNSEEGQKHLSFKCPICNAEHNNIQSSTKLPKNEIIEMIIQEGKIQQCNVESNSNVASTKTGCYNEDNNEATLYCTQCDYTENDNLECQKHPNQRMKLYCESCEMLICNICFKEMRNDTWSHSITASKKKTEKMKEKEKILKYCDTILFDLNKLNEEKIYKEKAITGNEHYIVDCQNKIDELQEEIRDAKIYLENHKKEKLMIEDKITEMKATHQLLITAINHLYSDSDFLDNQISKQLKVTISTLNEKIRLRELHLPFYFTNLPSFPDDEIWTLNLNSLKGSDCHILTEKTFQFNGDRNCSPTAITCIKGVTNGIHQWRIACDHTSGSYDYGLVIGFHKYSTSDSYDIHKIEKEFVGWDILRCKNWYYGEDSYIKNAIYKPYQQKQLIITLTLNLISKMIRIEIFCPSTAKSWNAETNLLYDFKEYFLHFRSHAVSFRLFSVILLDDGDDDCGENKNDKTNSNDNDNTTKV